MTRMAELGRQLAYALGAGEPLVDFTALDPIEAEPELRAQREQGLAFSKCGVEKLLVELDALLQRRRIDERRASPVQDVDQQLTVVELPRGADRSASQL